CARVYGSHWYFDVW
nr:immunoglobulin heavy chain junction region [Mus musculus]